MKRSKIPDPCITCRVNQYHHCQAQDMCGKVRRWKERMTKIALDEHCCETIIKNRRKTNAKK